MSVSAIFQSMQNLQVHKSAVIESLTH